jgi:cell division protein FtsL
MHLVLLILIALTLSLVINFVHQVIRSAQLEAQRSDLQREVARLETQTTHLEQAVEYVESDTYIERAAREQLGYAYEEDTVLLPRFVGEPTVTPGPTPINKASLPAREPNWQRWWQALFEK